MKFHEEHRDPVTDRRERRDRRVIPTRRKATRRDDDRQLEANVRLAARLQVLLVVLLVLVLPLVLVRVGVITAPSWLPIWMLYPERLLRSLWSLLDV